MHALETATPMGAQQGLRRQPGSVWASAPQLRGVPLSFWCSEGAVVAAGRSRLPRAAWLMTGTCIAVLSLLLQSLNSLFYEPDVPPKSYSAMQRGCRQDLLETKEETLALLMTLWSGMAVIFSSGGRWQSSELHTLQRPRPLNLCKLFARPKVEQRTPRWSFTGKLWALGYHQFCSPRWDWPRRVGVIPHLCGLPHLS